MTPGSGRRPAGELGPLLAQARDEPAFLLVTDGLGVKV